MLFRRKKKMEEEKDLKSEAAGQEEAAAQDKGEASAEKAESAARPDAESAATASESKPAQEEMPAGPDWKDMYARLLADFDNFKKRTARDREDTYRFAEAEIIKDILPAVDNLALALSKAENKEDSFVKGVQLVYDSLLSSLKERGAEPFDSIGKELDTDKMEAIAHLPSEEVEDGKVSQEVKRGWTMRGRTIRAAQVVVSAGKKQNG